MEELVRENGFDFALFPAKTEKPESLVVYLHGIGGNAEGFGIRARTIQKRIPGADVIALQAPIRIFHPTVPAEQKCYAWFPYGGGAMPQVKTWAAHIFNRLAIAGEVEAFAHAELEKRGLTEKNLGYIGSSMGAIVALQAALSGKTPVAAVVSRGGAVPPFTKVRSRPQVLLQMGARDGIFNPGAPRPGGAILKDAFAAAADRLSLRHERSLQRLRDGGVPVMEKIYPGQGHALNAKAWVDSAAFVAAALNSKPSP